MQDTDDSWRRAGGHLSRWVRHAGLGYLALCSACHGGPAGLPLELLGSWGGDGLALEAAHDTVSVRLDCAAGSLDAPVRLTPSGGFDVGGSYNSDLAPLAGRRPARWVGHVDGARLVVSVTVLGDLGGVESPTYGPFVGVRDAPAQVSYCR